QSRRPASVYQCQLKITRGILPKSQFTLTSISGQTMASAWRLMRMRFNKPTSPKYKHLALLGLLILALVQIFPAAIGAQHPGSAPVIGNAVEGQQATEPEGSLLNIVNWIGNVVSPLLAVGAVVMAIISYPQGRGVVRWAVTAVGLLMISG